MGAVLATEPGALSLGELLGAPGGGGDGLRFASLSLQHLERFAVADRFQHGEVRAIALAQSLRFFK